MARHRSSTLRRNRGAREARDRYLVYVEGRVGEATYIKGLRGELSRNGPVVKLGSTHGEPLTLVKNAVDNQRRAQRGGDPFDRVWCVFDVESPRPHDSLEKALSLAHRNNVSCAISNPCFELWLILHFADQYGYLTTDDACRRLEGLSCGYSRSDKSFRYEDCRELRAEAVKRARQLDARVDPASRVRDRNPWTSVWELVEELTRTS